MYFNSCADFDIKADEDDIFDGGKPDEIRNFEKKTGARVKFSGDDLADALVADISKNCARYIPIGEANSRYYQINNDLSHMTYYFDVTIKGESFRFNVDFLSNCQTSEFDYSQKKQTGAATTVLTSEVHMSYKGQVTEEHIQFQFESKFSYEYGKTKKDNGEVHLEDYDVTIVYEKGSKIKSLNVDFFDPKNTDLRKTFEKYFDSKKKNGLRLFE
jgi:hypothetical protein